MLYKVGNSATVSFPNYYRENGESEIRLLEFSEILKSITFRKSALSTSVWWHHNNVCVEWLSALALIFEEMLLSLKWIVSILA